MSIKREEKLALFLILAYGAYIVCTPFMLQYIMSVMLDAEADSNKLYVVLFSLAGMIGRHLHRIVSGVWLFVESRRAKNSSFVWTIFGIMFGLSGIMVFYGIQVLKEIKKSGDFKKKGREGVTL